MNTKRVYKKKSPVKNVKRVYKQSSQIRLEEPIKMKPKSNFRVESNSNLRVKPKKQIRDTNRYPSKSVKMNEDTLDKLHDTKLQRNFVIEVARHLTDNLYTMLPKWTQVLTSDQAEMAAMLTAAHLTDAIKNIDIYFKDYFGNMVK